MPAHLVPLVEVVSSPLTDAKVAEGLVKLLKDLNKAPIWVKKDVPGFVGNRLQHAMMREALYLIDDGVTDAEGIDTAVRYGFGFRFIACGPMMQKEMSGWDTNYLVGDGALPASAYRTETAGIAESHGRQGPHRHESQSRHVGLGRRKNQKGKGAYRKSPAIRLRNPACRQ